MKNDGKWRKFTDGGGLLPKQIRALASATEENKIVKVLIDDDVDKSRPLL